MNKQQQQLENSFNKHYSRFKLQMYFKKRNPITHYGHERVVTAQQIAWQRVKELILDRAKGLQDCKDRIELCGKLYGPFTTAIIYDKLQDNAPVLKIVGDHIELEELNNLWTISDKEIKCFVEHSPKGYKIIPMPNFAKELQKALNKK